MGLLIPAKRYLVSFAACIAAISFMMCILLMLFADYMHLVKAVPTMELVLLTSLVMLFLTLALGYVIHIFANAAYRYWVKILDLIVHGD